MAKKDLTPSEIVTSHKPKNFKYRYIIKDDEFLKGLENENFNMDELDTIHNDMLVAQAINAEYKLYERTIIGKAKEPTMMENGVIVSKKLVTKADKKLQKFGIGFFQHENVQYVSFRMYYEKFDIIEIFVLT